MCGKQLAGEMGTTRSQMKHHRNASKSNLIRLIYKHITRTVWKNLLSPNILT